MSGNRPIRTACVFQFVTSPRLRLRRTADAWAHLPRTGTQFLSAVSGTMWTSSGTCRRRRTPTHNAQELRHAGIVPRCSQLDYPQHQFNTAIHQRGILPGFVRQLARRRYQRYEFSKNHFTKNRKIILKNSEINRIQSDWQVVTSMSSTGDRSIHSEDSIHKLNRMFGI